MATLGLPCAVSGALAASADIQMIVCENKICPWFKVEAAPPPHWVEDSEFGDPRQLTVYGIPGRELPFIYVSASEVDRDSDPKRNVEDNQSSWLADHPGSRFKLRDAIGPFSVYEVRNPSLHQQP